MIDILLAVYNGQKYLTEQIDSLLAQTYSNYQILIRDDNSTDNSLEIIKEYCKQYPDKIKLVTDNLNNLGPSGNFSKLLEHSHNDYSMFCDQDDIWLPDKIKLTLYKMKAAEELYHGLPILIHSDMKVVDYELNTIAGSFWELKKIDPNKSNNLKNIIFNNTVTGCTAMINRNLRNIITPIPENVRVHDWWTAMNAAKYGKIFFIPQQTVLYRQHSNNIIGAMSKPLSFTLVITKLNNTLKIFSQDYKTIKIVYPQLTMFSLFINLIISAIKRRL